MGYSLGLRDREAYSPFYPVLSEGHLAQGCEFILVESNPDFWFPIYRILERVGADLPSGLAEQVRSIEEGLRLPVISNTPEFMMPFAEQMDWKSTLHTFKVKRRLSLRSVQDWIVGEGPSRQALDKLEETLTAEEWIQLKTALTDKLSGREIDWEQQFVLYSGVLMK